jgi:hypothetical protein
MGVSAASAQIRVTTSPDVTLELGTNLQAVDDGRLAIGSSQPSAVYVPPFSGIPASAAIAAYDVLDDGIGATSLLSFESDVELPGAILARRGDVVAVVGSGSYSILLDASAVGIPDGVVTDALASVGPDLVLSFDGTVDLGGGLIAADEDLVRWNGAAFVLAFDGSAAGLDESLDLDAVDRTGNIWAVSFDTGGIVNGVPFQDEDVLAYSNVAGAFSPNLVFEGAAVDPDWAAADVEAFAVPEAGTIEMLGWGGLVLLGLRRGRLRSDRIGA